MTMRLGANAARGAAAGQAGTLRIGFLASAALELLATIVPPWRAVAPAASLEFVEGSSGEHIAGVRERRLDVTFVRPTQPADDLVVEEVWREPVVAVVPAGSPLARRKSLRLKDLDGQPFVLFPRHRLRTFMTTSSTRAAGWVSCRRSHTSVRRCRRWWVWWLPDSAFRLCRNRSAASRETVAYRPLADVDLQARLAMVTAADNSRPLVSGFTDTVRRTLAR